jgi:cholesterol transport system auxiliary component
MTRIVAALALLLAVAACAGPPPPPESFHRIAVPAVAAPLARAPLPGALEVERFATDGVLAERALTYGVEGGALRHYAYDLWSEPPGLMLQGLLVRYLTAAGAAAVVVTPELRVLPDWTVRAKLTRFEQLAGGAKVAVEMELAVVSARDGHLMLLKTYGAEPATASGSIGDAVRALEQGVATIFGRFLADLAAVRP